MCSKQYISTENAPTAIGPYSQAIIAGDYLYASGQIPIDPKTGNIDGTDIKTQAKRCCLNVGEILKAANLSFDNIDLINKYNITHAQIAGFVKR